MDILACLEKMQCSTIINTLTNGPLRPPYIVCMCESWGKECPDTKSKCVDISLLDDPHNINVYLHVPTGIKKRAVTKIDVSMWGNDSSKMNL